jgi:rhodanese-related sulfurtransferase
MMPLTETGALTADGALWIAPLIGFAFGFLLERAGLAHAPRLAGQFYFTDFTVFKVLFTALVTAMLGAFWLDRVGLLDIELLYIPETFVLAQAVGGVLFGAGFLLSGLCPGTSCVAAASGRLDGLAVVGGILVGVLLFNLAYDFLSPLYSATPLGRITLAQVAGVPTGVMLSAITAFALGAFIVLGRWRRSESVADNGGFRSRAFVAAAATLAVAAAVLDLRSPAEASSLATTPSLAGNAPSERDYISAIELGERIAREDPTLRLIDLRDPTEYERFHIPGATRTTLDDLPSAPLPSDATVVIYDSTGVAAAQAQTLLRRRGHTSVLVLREGLYEWIARVHEPRLAVDATPVERQAFERAAKLSRFFGGTPQAGVPRADVQRGYWNGAASNGDAPARLRDAVAAVRRRGC